MNGNIVNMRALAGMAPACVASLYGLKTAGVVHLMNVRADSPHPYLVPPAFAVAAGRHREISPPALREAFDALSSGMRNGGALLVRSSDVEEKPGRNKTLFVRVDSRNRDASFAKLQKALRRVCGSSKGMGALLMPLVSGPARSFSGDLVLGVENVSFIANSHAAADDHEMYVAFVNGLGTRVVNEGTDFIPMTVDRKSGRVTSFVNKTERAALHFTKSMAPVADSLDYRQAWIDFFSLRNGKIVAGILSNDALVDAQGQRLRPYLMVEDGALRLFDWRNEEKMGYDEFVVTKGIQYLGWTPFTSPEPPTRLIAILRYLASRSEVPIQIEGAFAGLAETAPHLYQHIDLPPITKTPVQVDLEGVDCSSKNVIGSCDVQVPLVALENTAAFIMGMQSLCAELKRMDEQFSKTGYALLADRHPSQVIALTPHCRVRLSLGNENMASHAATYARILQAQNPGSVAVLASQVQMSEPMQLLFTTLRTREPSSTSWGVAHLLSPRAHIRSNGRALSVDLDPPEQPESAPTSPPPGNAFSRWLRSLFGNS